MRLALCLFALPVLLAAQPVETWVRAAHEVIEAGKYCFLITVDAAGQPQARLMQQFPPEPDLTIWMGTNPRSRKVAQIRANPRATVACSDAEGPGYVTLTGRARLVESLTERRKRWRADWDAHFPGGPAGANYILIEFLPERMELVSGRHNLAATPGTPRPPTLVRQRGVWRLVP
jgi:general stress protein 26